MFADGHEAVPDARGLCASSRPPACGVSSVRAGTRAEEQAGKPAAGPGGARRRSRAVSGEAPHRLWVRVAGRGLRAEAAPGGTAFPVPSPCRLDPVTSFIFCALRSGSSDGRPSPEGPAARCSPRSPWSSSRKRKSSRSSSTASTRWVVRAAPSGPGMWRCGGCGRGKCVCMCVCACVRVRVCARACVRV